MAYCPECLVEYVEGKTECMDCHVALRPGPPPTEADDSGDDVELVSIRDFGTGEAWAEELDPELACAVLEKEGIPAQLASGARSELGVVLGGMPASQLFVRKEDVGRATELLKAYFDAPAQAPGDPGES